MEDIVKIYCDGGCRGNQFKENIGGWGVHLEYKSKIKELYGGEKNTTNNRMELTSCIKGLEAINRKTFPVEVIMDSQYVISAFNEKWIDGWIKRGWRTSQKKPVENKDLWLRLIELTKQFKDITFTKCRGHADNDGNNKADELANIAMSEIES